MKKILNSVLLLSIISCSLLFNLSSCNCKTQPLTRIDSANICEGYMRWSIAHTKDSLKSVHQKLTPSPLGEVYKLTPPPLGDMSVVRTVTVVTTVDKGKPMIIKAFNADRRAFPGTSYSDTISASTEGNMLVNYGMHPFVTGDAQYFLFDAYTLYNFIQKQNNIQDVVMRLGRDVTTQKMTLIISGIANDNSAIMVGTSGQYLEHCYPCPECE